MRAPAWLAALALLAGACSEVAPPVEADAVADTAETSVAPVDASAATADGGDVQPGADADAAVSADAEDTLDAVPTEETADAADAADPVDGPDSAETADAGEAPDTPEAADAVDAPDSAAGTDAVEAPDTADAADAVDAPDTADDADAADTADTADATDTGATGLPGDVTCDGGDENWVRRALPLLAGRKPKGIGEVRALAQMVALAGRKNVAKAMTLQPNYNVRWVEHVFDILRVDRQPPETQPACTLAGAPGSDGGVFAAQVRDNTPQAPATASGKTLRDLAKSALDLDDLSPLLRGRLFQMLAAPSPYCGNTPALEMDLTRRNVFGERFGAAYLGRNLGCLGCHNSTWGVGDHPDPAQDHHWPIAGQFEKAVFGEVTGRPPEEVHALFRYHGVIGKAAVMASGEQGSWPADPAPAIRPWGWSAKCGEFLPVSAVGPDPSGVQAWFGGKLAGPASVWHLEDLLHKGVVAVGKAAPLPSPEVLAQQPATAFAWLVAARVADGVWQVAMGAPLQQSHGFARNAAQRDRLQALTTTLLANHWSLRALLLDIATDPLFNPAAPQAGCGTSAYPWPLVFDPFASDTPDKSLHGNGPGDALHRERGTVLANLALLALDRSPLGPQTEMPPKSGKFEPTVFLTRQLGSYIDDGAQGFGEISYVFLSSWNSFLAFLPMSAAPVASPSGQDWLGQLQTAALANPTMPLRAVVVAITDRFWSAPDLDPALEPAIAAHFDVADLNTPIGQVANLSQQSASLVALVVSDMLFYATPMALALQKTTPGLVVGNAGFADACEAWAPAVFDPAKWTVACTDSKVVVSAKSQ